MNDQIVQYEKVIDLKKFLISCLRMWKILIIAALVGAAVFGAMNAVSQISEPTEVETEAESDKKADKKDDKTEETAEEDKGFDIVDLAVQTVLGAVIGVFAVCAYVFLRTCIKIFGSRFLYSAEDVLNQLCIPILGSFYVPLGSKLSLHPMAIDYALDKFEGADRVVDEENTYAVIAAKLNVMAEGKKTVLVVGTAEKSALEEVACQLNKKGSLGSPVCVAADILQNPDDILKLNDSLVLLAESEFKAVEKDFVKILELLAQAKADFVGAVIL